MSYCRFSSNNWMCDVYVYESVYGGFQVHVAGRRRPIRPIPDLVGGRFSLAVHRWSGAEFDKDTHKVRYPQAWKGFICGLWYTFATFWHNKIHMGSLRLIPLREIGLSRDGGSFVAETPDECADLLEDLRKEGYVVPQYAIDALREEAKDWKPTEMSDEEKNRYHGTCE